MLFLPCVRHHDIRVIHRNLDDLLLIVTLAGQSQVCLFPFVNKKQNMDKHHMCLLLNNSYEAFSIYGVEHAVKHVAHQDL